MGWFNRDKYKRRIELELTDGKVYRTRWDMYTQEEIDAQHKFNKGVSEFAYMAIITSRGDKHCIKGKFIKRLSLVR